VPNQPDENTVATSFTLPRPLFSALQRKAKMEMTNQSDVVRRALMNYLPADERAMVLRDLDAAANPPDGEARRVNYRKRKPGGK